MCTCIYIYIYIERERDPYYIYWIIYIYICIYILHARKQHLRDRCGLPVAFLQWMSSGMFQWISVTCSTGCSLVQCRAPKDCHFPSGFHRRCRWCFPTELHFRELWRAMSRPDLRVDDLRARRDEPLHGVDVGGVTENDHDAGVDAVLKHIAQSLYTCKSLYMQRDNAYNVCNTSISICMYIYIERERGI